MQDDQASTEASGPQFGVLYVAVKEHALQIMPFFVRVNTKLRPTSPNWKNVGAAC